VKILMLSKALVVGAYQRKLEEIARHGEVDLVAVVPTSWRDRAYEMRLERVDADCYELASSPIVFNGSYHLFFFPRLGRLLEDNRPDILHIDEEPYNLATFLSVLGARRRGIPALFFTWQNLVRSYPPPFNWMERYGHRHSAWAIAGTNAAGEVLRAKGYRGAISIIPQFGVDPDIYRPGERSPRPFTVGFAGRLVPEKGVALLVDACARLGLDFRLSIAGAGPAEGAIRARIAAHGLQDRITLEGAIPSALMPEWLQGCDLVVLPSVSRPNWVEQFGRALVEAMACGVAVLGSTCGEIPRVIDDAGLVFPEGDASALASALDRLAREPELRAELGARGRQRVIERFTHDHIARATIEVYRAMLSEAGNAPARSA